MEFLTIKWQYFDNLRKCMNMFGDVSDGPQCSCARWLPAGCHLGEPSPDAVSSYCEGSTHAHSYVQVHMHTSRLMCVASELTLKSAVLHCHIHACVFTPSPHSYSSSVSEFAVQLFGIWNIFVQSDSTTQAHVVVRSMGPSLRQSLPRKVAELRFSSHEHTDPLWDTVPWGLAPGERTWREAGRAPGSPAGARHQELCSGAWERGSQPADWRLLKPELMGRPGFFERFHCRRRR